MSLRCPVRLSATEHVTGNGTTWSYLVFSVLFSSAAVTIQPGDASLTMTTTASLLTGDPPMVLMYVSIAHTSTVSRLAPMWNPCFFRNLDTTPGSPSSHLLQQIPLPAALQPHVSVHHVDAIRVMPVGCANRAHRSPVAVFRRDNVHVTGLLVPGRGAARITDNDDVAVVVTTRGLSSAHVPTVPYFCPCPGAISAWRKQRRFIARYRTADCGLSRKMTVPGPLFRSSTGHGSSRTNANSTWIVRVRTAGTLSPPSRERTPRGKVRAASRCCARRTSCRARPRRQRSERRE